MARRWRNNGTDYHTGHVADDRGPGGMVCSQRGFTWSAYAWTKGEAISRVWLRRFKSLETAKRAVERWLDSHARIH